MQLLSIFNKLLTGQQPPIAVIPSDDRTATRPMEAPRDRDATRPSQPINDPKWLKIQKAIDQAG